MSDQPKHSEVKKEKKKKRKGLQMKFVHLLMNLIQKRELGNLEYLLLPRS